MDDSRFKGFVSGLLGGAAGLVAMAWYWQQVAPKVEGGKRHRRTAWGRTPSARTLDNISVVGTQSKKEESSTAALGRIVYAALAGKEPKSKETQELLANLVHWGYGIGQGGVYGALRSDADGADLSGGIAFALGLWLLGDELVVPLLGLQSGPTAASAAQHANRLGAHITYGAVTAVTTQVLCKLL